MPPFGNEGHFFVGSTDTIPMWSPLVKNPSTRINSYGGWRLETQP